MPLTPDERQTLQREARCLGVDLDDAVADRLGAYLDRVYGWQARRNVTAVARDQAVARHLVDSLVLAPHLLEGARVLDVGTGAGFPGMVLALARTDLRLTLAERSGWLAERLQRAASELGLESVSVLARDLRPGTVEPGAADAVVSRAALRLPVLLRLARHALAPRGRLLLQLGPQTVEAYRAMSQAGFCEDAMQRYQLGDGVERFVVRLIRLDESPSE